MNQVPLEVLEGRVDRLAARLARFGVLLTLAGGLVLGLGVWNLNQTHELNRARQRAIGLNASFDSLRAAYGAADLRAERAGKRLGVLEERADRLSGGVRHSELIAARAWISRLESRIDSNEDRVSALGQRLEEGLEGVRDSLRASRAWLESDVRERFAVAGRPGGVRQRPRGAPERRGGRIS